MQGICERIEEMAVDNPWGNTVALRGTITIFLTCEFSFNQVTLCEFNGQHIYHEFHLWSL